MEHLESAIALRHHFWGKPQRLDWPGQLKLLETRGLCSNISIDQLKRWEQQKPERVDAAGLSVASSQDIALIADTKWLGLWQNNLQKRMELPAVIVIDHRLAHSVQSSVGESSSRKPLLIVSKFPKVAFGQLVEALYPKASLGWSADDYAESLQSGPHIAPSAYVAQSATLGPGTQVAPGAVVGCGAVLGEKCTVGPNATIGARVVLGDRCSVGAGARIFATVAGSHCHFRANAVIGERGYGVCLAPALSGTNIEQHEAYNIPQIAAVRIGDRCELRHGSVVDRGALSDTILSDDVHIDSQSIVGHGATIGARVSVGALCGIGGQATLGEDCIVYGGSAVLEGRTLAPRCIVQVDTIVTKSHLQPAEVLMGVPAVPAETWKRRIAYINRLFKMHVRERS